MADSNTFSALVDLAILRANRPDRRQDAVSYARTTIRECTVKAFFKPDFVETSITPTALPCVWTVPQGFRQLAFAQYPFWRNDGTPIFGKEKTPSNVGPEDLYWYYRAGSEYVFSGMEAGAELKLGYYKFNRKFYYYQTEANRPATYDEETGVWAYHADYQATAELQETARDLVTSWLIFNWFDLLLEGTLAKIYKTANDPRAGSTYGLYKSLQTDLLAGVSNATV